MSGLDGILDAGFLITTSLGCLVAITTLISGIAAVHSFQHWMTTPGALRKEAEILRRDPSAHRYSNQVRSVLGKLEAFYGRPLSLKALQYSYIICICYSLLLFMVGWVLTGQGHLGQIEVLASGKPTALRLLSLLLICSGLLLPIWFFHSKENTLNVFFRASESKMELSRIPSFIAIALVHFGLIMSGFEHIESLLVTYIICQNTLGLTWRRTTIQMSDINLDKPDAETVIISNNLFIFIIFLPISITVTAFFMGQTHAFVVFLIFFICKLIFGAILFFINKIHIITQDTHRVILIFTKFISTSSLLMISILYMDIHTAQLTLAILFIFILPIPNAAADFFSSAISRWLGARLPESREGETDMDIARRVLALSLVDFLLAAFCLMGLAGLIGLFGQAWPALTSLFGMADELEIWWQQEFDMALFDPLENGLWLTLMLATTFLWSLGHMVLAVRMFLKRIPRLSDLARKMEQWDGSHFALLNIVTHYYFYRLLHVLVLVLGLGVLLLIEDWPGIFSDLLRFFISIVIGGFQLFQDASLTIPDLMTGAPLNWHIYRFHLDGPDLALLTFMLIFLLMPLAVLFLRKLHQLLQWIQRTAREDRENMEQAMQKRAEQEQQEALTDQPTAPAMAFPRDW